MLGMTRSTIARTKPVGSSPVVSAVVAAATAPQLS